MKYYELKLTYPGIAEEERTGITIADLSDMGFESFQQAARHHHPQKINNRQFLYKISHLGTFFPHFGKTLS